MLIDIHRLLAVLAARAVRCVKWYSSVRPLERSYMTKILAFNTKHGGRNVHLDSNSSIENFIKYESGLDNFEFAIKGVSGRYRIIDEVVPGMTRDQMCRALNYKIIEVDAYRRNLN